MIGYDKLALNHQLLLGLTFEEMTGTITHDRAKPEHPCTLHGATIAWGSLATGCPYIDFTAATPDWIDCPAAATADLNFIAGDFSGAMWICPDNIVNATRLFCRGLTNTDGWAFYFSLGDLGLVTDQVGVEQGSYAADVLTVGAWTFIGFNRSGALVNIFINGIDRTTHHENHIAPVTANRELHIGIYDNEILFPYDGKMWYPRIWGRQLAEWEMLEIFNIERHWFGV